MTTHRERLAEILAEEGLDGVIRLLADAWEDGARNGSRGLLPEAKRVARNPYIDNPSKDGED